jgi:ELWxxDGT repeat protein
MIIILKGMKMNRKTSRSVVIALLLMINTSFAFSSDVVSSNKYTNKQKPLLSYNSTNSTNSTNSIDSSVLPPVIYELEPNREMDTKRGSDISHIVNHQGNLWFYSENAIWMLNSNDGVLNKVVASIEKVYSGIHNRTPYLLVGDKLIYGKDRKIHVANFLGETEFTIEGTYNEHEGFISSGASGDGVYFHVYFDDDSLNKADLLYTDGTKEGTKTFDLCSDYCENQPRQIVKVGSSAYFSASLNPELMSNKRSLVVAHSDGTFIELANPEKTNNGITSIIPLLDGVLVSTLNPQETLLHTNGTLDSTQSISPEDSVHFGDVSEAKVLNDKLILAADELFIFDANDLGKKPIVIDVDPRKEGGDIGSDAKSLTKVNNELFFIAWSEHGPNNGNNSNIGLWKTNGTEEGTRLIFDFKDYIVQNIQVIGNKGGKVFLRVLAQLDKNSEQEAQLWISDGTALGTIRIGEDIVFLDNGNNEKVQRAFHANRFYFRGHKKDNNIELYSTDGTEEGTHIAHDLKAEQTIKQEGIIFQVGNDVYTQMLRVITTDSGDESNYEVWQWNIEQSELIQTTVFPNRFSYSGSGVRLQAAFPTNDGQFWWTNTQESELYDLSFYQPNHNSLTPILSEFDFNYCESQEQFFSSQRLIGNKLYFHAGAEYKGNSSCQLWVSDGTSEGTFPITNFSEDDFNSRSIESIVDLSGKAFINFSGANESNKLIETQIWEIDGTTNNTTTAFSFPETHEYFGTNISGLQGSKNHLFFIATKYDDLGGSQTGIFSFKDGEVETIHDKVENLAEMTTSGTSLIYVIGKDLHFSTGYADGVKRVVEFLKPDTAIAIENISNVVISPNKDKVMFKAYTQQGELYLWIADGNGDNIKPLQKTEVHDYFTVQAQNTDSLFLRMQTSEQSSMNMHSIYKLDIKTSALIEVGSYKSDENLPVVATDYAIVLAGAFGYSTGIQDPSVGGPYIYSELITGEDYDNDGTVNELDALPLNMFEQFDVDNDAIGDNKDKDNDNDGFNDVDDLFPTDAKEWLDSDLDGIGNNSDIDDDNDNVTDWLDSYPLDINKQVNPDDTTPLVVTVPPTPQTPITPPTLEEPLKKEASSSGGSIYYMLGSLFILLSHRRKRRF